MGVLQTEQPLRRKPTIGPGLMISAPAPAFLPLPQTEQTPQTHTHPTIHIRERRRFAVLEVLIPAAQTRLHVADDFLQAAPFHPPRLDPQALAQLVQALRLRPFHAALEVVAQKIK